MRKFPRTVVILGLVSLFTDLSSEMIYPLLPVFLSGVLGATALELGVIEGFAESTASLLKVASGLWTDRINKRKPIILLGYSLSSLFRPMMGLAQAWQGVFVLRLLDRIGKGLRSSPRDALLADVTDPSQRGAAFGFHRAMDHAGAVMGPLAASALLLLPGMNLRNVFILAALPGAAAVAFIIFGIQDSKTRSPAQSSPEKTFHPLRDWKLLGSDFRLFLVALFLFTLGNSTDAFLLIRLSQGGISPSIIAILWSAHHIVKMIATYHGGRFSDRRGRKTSIILGWGFYALTYLAFAFVESPSLMVGIFLLYGLYFGFVEPSERALVADLAPASLRGTAFGYFYFVVGIAALPASILFGYLWHTYGVSTAFLTGAILAMLASLLLLMLPQRRE